MSNDEGSKVLGGLNSPKGGSPLATATVIEGADDAEEVQVIDPEDAVGRQGEQERAGGVPDPHCEPTVPTTTTVHRPHRPPAPLSTALPRGKPVQHPGPDTRGTRGRAPPVLV